MKNLFSNEIPEYEIARDTQYLFVDEAGDPTLFANRRTPIIQTNGCSRYFMLGKLDVENPVELTGKLMELHGKISSHPYFAGVPSFDPARKKTAIAFHAKDDLPEVRFQVFDFLMNEGKSLRFHAVVCDKMEVLKLVQEKNNTKPEYWYNQNELYDELIRNLFGKFHRLADNYNVYVARRGSSDRNEALRKAIVEHADEDFKSRFGFSRGNKHDWNIEVDIPENKKPLQAVDYFLWALQRFYEPRPHHKTGVEQREERFLQMLWPQIGEIHDMHFGSEYGTFFTKTDPISLEKRFGDKTKKKKS